MRRQGAVASVSLARSVHVPPTMAPSRLLDSRGPRVVIGNAQSSTSPAAPLVASAKTLFGPRGAVLARPGGPLFVSDTGHHRVLVWIGFPEHDEVPADCVLGQPDFAGEARNGSGQVGPATFNMPAGIATAGDVLAVADSWNNRVLIWHRFPTRANTPADLVLGQPDFSSASPNRGFDAPRADTLNWCSGVAIQGDLLVVADTGNRRVLVWDGIPTRNGAPADLVLGQSDFLRRDEGGGRDGDSVGMRWPHGVATFDNLLFVTDAGDSRVMAWCKLPSVNGAACDFLLGQGDFRTTAHNAGAQLPGPATMNMPYGACVTSSHLVIADTANSRLLGFDVDELAMGAPAVHLEGQDSFAERGENKWRAVCRNTLCWPYSVTACGSTLTVADTGNNRILLWDLA